MGDKPSISIPINTEKGRFANHLEIGNNQRIIFSSPFGTGKTYFLERFFDEKKEVYEPFFLSPVHYSVSRNEDVFEYIKYDILISLFSKQSVEWKETHLSNEMLKSFFVEENFLQIAKDTIKHVGKVGKIVSDVIDDINKYKTKFEEFKAKSNTDQSKDAKTYVDDFEKKIGSIFEYDENTTLINELLGTIEKEKVLIVDDLDRMDPEHIFRILNVFSAQFDHERFGYNKFAFDKVIIVCDLDNIRNLFAHKYGSNVDFSGYIDKFYSIEPFVFDNRKELIDEITKFILSNLKDSNLHHEVLESMIRILVEKEVINLRKFVSKYNSKWNSPTLENYNLNQYPYISVLLLDYLLYLHGYIEQDLCKELSKIDYIIEWSTNKWIDFLCPFIDENFKTIDPGFSKNSSEISKIKLQNLDLTIEYEVEVQHAFTRQYYTYINKIYNYNMDQSGLKTLPALKLLAIAIENYSSIKRKLDSYR